MSLLNIGTDCTIPALCHKLPVYVHMAPRVFDATSALRESIPSQLLADKIFPQTLFVEIYPSRACYAAAHHTI